MIEPRYGHFYEYKMVNIMEINFKMSCKSFIIEKKSEKENHKRRKEGERER